MSAISKIDHIVILMLENRSFDHMIGALRLAGHNVNGLTGAEANVYQGKKYNVTPRTAGVFPWDPCHSATATERQLRGNNGGFVESFVVDAGVGGSPGAIMGYQQLSSVPVYDWLATHYCVCDRWFSSVRGPTQPNRVYAMAGTTKGVKDNIVPKKGWFDIPTVFDHLTQRNISWRCFAHDISTLRFFKKHRFSPANTGRVSEFFALCRGNQLPSVSWIDPDFGILPDLSRPNDDHPPHDIARGQALVASVCRALMDGPSGLFERVLLIVVYDEHGGFYDHEIPPPVDDDYEDFRHLGVRVPAFLVSPWVSKASVFSETVDHTSIIKTIAERFCPDVGERMGLRVKKALSVWKALADDMRHDTDRPLVPDAAPAPLAEENAQRTELQDELEALANECMANGLRRDEL